jgi:DNA-binding NtrC family response regulator
MKLVSNFDKKEAELIKEFKQLIKKKGAKRSVIAQALADKYMMHYTTVYNKLKKHGLTDSNNRGFRGRAK